MTTLENKHLKNNVIKNSLVFIRCRSNGYYFLVVAVRLYSFDPLKMFGWFNFRYSSKKHITSTNRLLRTRSETIALTSVHVLVSCRNSWSSVRLQLSLGLVLLLYPCLLQFTNFFTTLLSPFLSVWHLHSFIVLFNIKSSSFDITISYSVPRIGIGPLFGGTWMALSFLLDTFQ